jgi:Amt family ammonium transporter
MKRLLAMLALIGALGIPGLAYSEDKPAATAAPAAASPAAAAPTAAAPATEAPAAASPAAAPPPAPTKPEKVKADKINSGDTAWMLTSTALVLFMTIPGLALFYGGMVRKKNVLATLMQSFAITCLVTILWTICGYSLAFMPGSEYLGSFTARLFLNGMSYMKDAGELTVHHLGVTIPESVFMMFQLTFAIITPALIAGAFAERMKFSAMLWFMGLWSLLVYAPIRVSVRLCGISGSLP